MEPEEFEGLRMVNISLNYQGSDFLLEVDEKTANILLNDPIAAENYLHQLNIPTFDVINPEKTDENDITDDGSIIWTARKPTLMDGEATSLFLKLRSKYSKEFNDKKTLKAQVWAKIAAELQKTYNLGDSPIEKCRQKFSNLQKQYFKHITHMKTTGTDFKEPPPYFDELHDILGGKDKSSPQNLQDSLKNIDIQNKDMTESKSEEKDDSVAGPSKDNTLKIKQRFSKPLQSEKPQSNTDKILNVLQQQHKQENENHQKHFNIMEDAIKAQKAQGDRLLSILENVFANKNKTRKRRRSSTDESD